MRIRGGGNWSKSQFLKGRKENNKKTEERDK
jgi:hypothetical protein